MTWLSPCPPCIHSSDKVMSFTSALGWRGGGVSWRELTALASPGQSATRMITSLPIYPLTQSRLSDFCKIVESTTAFLRHLGI